MYDMIIRNATVIDGTGNPRYFADVALKDGKIARIGKALRGTADAEVDGTGKVLSPGFIDVHSHQDLQLEKHFLCSGSLEQGVTTLVGGMCGHSPMPISHEHLDDCLRYAGTNHSPESVAARFDTAEYLKFIDRPYGVNIAFLAGHGTLRDCVVGYADRKLTNEEQAAMAELLRQAMEAGCYGVSFGLIYPPGGYADTEELIGMAKVAARYGGVVTVHMRSEGNQLIESVDEMMRVTRASNVRMIISHHKASQGPMNWNKTAATLSLMEQTIADGFDVFCDQYPYTASCTGLKSIIPQALHARGVDKMIELVTTPEGRAELREQVFHNDDSRKRLQYLMFGSSKTHPDFAGHMINEIADSLGVEPFELFCDVLRDDGLGTQAVFCNMSEEDVERVMQWPRAMVGTDGSYRPGTRGSHPRSIATFPRILGHYVRERGLISLEEAVRKMCYLPAMVYNFPTKGLIREGMDADLVLFDPETVGDHADYAVPTRPNTGIDYVFVAGQIAVRDGKATGVMAGRQLRKALD